MLWAGNKTRPRDLYLGTRAAAWCDSAGTTVTASVEGFEAALSWTQAQLADKGYSGRLRIWLSGGLCRPFLLPDFPGVRDDKEIQRVATRLASERTGLAGDCKVWLDGARRGEARVGVAVEQEKLSRLHDALGARWRIAAVQPWWAEVLSVALSRPDAPSALGVHDCDSLTVLVGKKSGFSMATTINPVLDEASADSSFTRALLSADMEPGRELLARLVLAPSRSPGPPSSALSALMEFSR